MSPLSLLPLSLLPLSLLSLLLACDVPAEAPLETPAEVPPTEAPLTETSKEALPALYELDPPLLTQSGAQATLSLQRGHPTILSMFYTSCKMACPLLIQDIQGIEAALPPAQREALRVVLVSMDPTHDTPEAMQAVVAQHHLDARWTLGAVPDAEVRTVAAALGVRYRQLPDGGFAHTAVLTLVDAEGRVVARAEGAEGRDALIAALQGQLEGVRLHSF